MTWLGTAVAVAVTAVVPPGPVTAAPAADGSVVVRSTCQELGRVVVRKHDRGGHTHVSVDGIGVADRRWTGEYWLEVGVDDTNDEYLRFRSRDGRFHQEFDVDGTGTSASLDLERGRPQACFAGYDEKGRYTVLSGTDMRVLVRHRDVEQVGIRGSVDCRIGSAWRVTVRVEFGDRDTRFESVRRTCRRGWTEFGGSTGLAATQVDRPTAISLVAHGFGGQVRRAELRVR
ncbi:hypothetical protein [Nocardioides sp. SR21]|uniref:hypothetical protein n=1 Tax=Nocardioides sp. SR21 TaxID=2919501 RepID=UPI001FA9AB6D|nr:hypothetical protein [Nocardioides sp. SR21]